MFSINKISLILFYLLCVCETNSYRIGSKCGFPGLPHETKIEPEKNIYEDGEEVTYKCPDDKIYLKTQVKKCVAGVWTGHRSTCGYFLRNQLMRVKIIDNNSGEVVFEGETSNYTASGFPASFYNSRGTAVTIKEAHKPHKWYFNFSNPMSFDFFLLNIRIPKSIPLTSSAINQIDAIRVKSVHIINEPHRNCTIDFSTLDRSSKIFWFWCTVNDSITSDEPISISLITSAAQPITILGLHQIYFTKLQYCGQPQVPLLAKHVSDNEEFKQIQCDPKVAIDANENQLSSKIVFKDFDRFHSCVDDEYWAGNPKCLPKMFCHLNYNELTEEISSVENAYIFNETKWYAIEGTVVEYKCKTGFNLVTNSKRTCLQNSRWDQNDSTCFDLKSDGSKEKS
jgi:hypothetical protein